MQLFFEKGFADCEKNGVTYDFVNKTCRLGA
jgi:hypothetical protein